MKCLTLMQPWATLVILGVKCFETRSWRTEYRGPLAIHASRTFTEAARALCRQEPFRSALLVGGYRYPSDLPTRALLGTVDLVECSPALMIASVLPASHPELHFGDFRGCRWAWRLDNPYRLEMPKPYPGRLGLYEIPDLFPQEVCA